MIDRTRFGLCALGLLSSVTVSCSRGDGAGGARAAAAPSVPTPRAPTQPNYFAGPPDDSMAVVQRHPRVDVAYPTVSAPFRDIPAAAPSGERFEREPRRSPFPFAAATQPDPVIQLWSPISPLILTVQSFLGQGETLGACVFPRPDMGEPAGCTTTGDPPDTNGVVGLDHYVQAVNGGIAVWSKSGSIVMSPKLLKTLWAGYVGTNTGNGCATQNDGDPVVLYDQLADRWFVTQFSLPNYDQSKGPSFQCVAVSQTGDPTGAYYLYDFQYSAVINDYGKFGVWPDAYYASFNNFSAVSSQGANVCAYDRGAMLQGKAATQHCFQQSASTFGLLPSSVDGPIKPPDGEPAFFVSLRSATSIGLYKFHVDWVTPANSTFTGPTSLSVASYNQLCNGGSCIAQTSPGNALASLGDRPMFHLSYRNFGTLESLVFNHSVKAGSVGGPRWYEIRSPNATPVVFQQGTYAPGDGKYRWMGSIAQDQAQDFALGYSISSSTTVPSIAWTGRTATDTAGTMGQAEVVVQSGVGVETGTFSDGSTANRWGDYSNMSVDPSDDCTFWYTQERYPSDGVFNWDTGIASAKFANCAMNDFSISVTPATSTVAPGGQTAYTVTTASTKGSAESIDLVVQDLPAGVTGAFSSTSVTAGSSSTLTLTAAANAPGTGTPAPTFLVIGKATSAVHAASAQVSVVACVKITTCPTGTNCGTISDGCGGTLSCGPACTAPQTCGGGGTANVCGCTPSVTCPAGANCGSVDNGCGMMVSCGPACTAPQTCGGGGTANVCGCTPSVTCPAGADCGSVDDGCGAMVSCGSACTAPQSCGGGGMPNVCGCTKTTCAAQQAQCGTIDDGCGGTLTCNACAADQTCVANQCVANTPPDLATNTPPDLATGTPPDLATGSPDLATGGGHKGGGCGCHIAERSGTSGPWAFLVIGLALGAALLRRRAHRSRSLGLHGVGYLRG